MNKLEHNPCNLCRFKDNIKNPCPLTEEELAEKPHFSKTRVNCTDLSFKDFKSKDHSEGVTKEKIANYMISLRDYKTMNDTEEIYYYDGGIYRPNAEVLIKEFVEKHCTDINTHSVREILAHIQRKTYVNRSDFDKDSSLITVENGIVNIRSGELKDCTPDYLSLIRIPILYDNNARCPVIDKFISEIVAPEDLKTLYEVAGFCLIKQYFIHKAIMLHGETHSGKTTFIKLLCRMVGEENVSHEPLQTLLADRFATSQLYTKLINASSDLPNSPVRQTGIFKMLTGEDKISAQKKFKDKFTFENTAKLLFSCNEIPQTKDKTDAFFIRWMIINFPNRFDDNNPNTDKKLIHKLTIPFELSGFLNKALSAAKELLEREHFTNNPDVNSIRDHYEKLSNPIYAFVTEFCIKDEDSSILKTDLYEFLTKL